jgi:sulfate/thiosulfate-binding protein
MKHIKISILTIITGLTLAAITHADRIELLNVSYDPTREFYREYNVTFEKNWKAKTGQTISMHQSHGGSGKQARSIIDGLEGDVVTLALAYDIDNIVTQAKAIAPNWQSRLPNNSSPYTSTIVFLVRKGNPKKIKDWNDLAAPGIQVITPNPKTSGGARWNFLAAWAYGLKTYKTETSAKQFVAKLFKNAPVLDSGARGSTTTFVERNIGDVLITWENEALLIDKKINPNEFEIIYPSLSILAEPPVTWVDASVKKHKSEALAKAYLTQLYDIPAQELAAKHFYRPSNPKVLAKYKTLFPNIKLVTINDTFGGWKAAHDKFFKDKAIFDAIYQPK